jgi:2-iminobutanoate/2-iminopropanoate deaminase
MTMQSKKTISLKKINTPEAPKAIGPYSQAISDGQYVFVSGQLPIEPSTGKLIQADIRTQTKQVLDNLEAILKAAEVELQSVVRVDIFLKDLNHFSIVNEEYAKRFNSPITPARQTIQVAKLPLDAEIEISCIARI